MTAWQYLAGAGLVAALCPLHGHVAVASDGHGRGARVDLCVPGGEPGRPVFRPPSVRTGVPGAERPTVHHPGRSPEPPAVADRPEPSRPSGVPEPPSPAGPAAEARAAGTEPPGPAPDPGSDPGPERADAPAPPRPRAAAAAVSAFHVRPYRAVALERRGPGGMSTMMLMVVVTTPAVLAAAALRPRSKSRG
ncbi:hypothetical protein OG765_06930 [Streptomyces sp. NBC_00555]|uniref:hypothetical protein n=1 Tax=unclassified Streptomyces TaxID=2593676 RepID=UPI00214B1412|nr:MULTISPECIES: hypothetical protein [unclassified Streptomyces]MCX5010715.1 hypothetical protein [Streptomyces sp. NBC_00555]MCX5611166.1 hypothetical protein [Streptomyces sp. NBC_00047]UUU39051.1 hypothetical protein JIW86_09800 [Streptomyces sp. NBC_00162]